MERLGAEVEIRRVGAPWRGNHVAVRERTVSAPSSAAALFGPLDCGPYELRWRGAPSGPLSLVDVRPGAVAETTLA
jgi:hypothetical protein